MQTNEAKNVTQWLDSLSFNRFHGLVVLLSAMVCIFDGYDSQIIAYVMPQVIREWKLTPIVAGSIASYGFLGLMVGSASFGMIADRIGRKTALMLALTVFTSFSGVAAFAPNFTIFCILRFLAGLGMGGALPVVLGIASEFSPARIRGKVVTGVFAGFTGGWALAGGVAMWIIPALGWRSALFVGFIPIAVLPILKWLCPESVRFLASKGHLDEAIAQMRRVERAAGVKPIEWKDEHFHAGPVVMKHGRVRDLFGHHLASITLVLWFSTFFSLLVVYGLSTWLPTMLVKQGMSLVKSYSYGFVQAVGASVGGFLCGWVMDWLGRKRAMIVFYCLAAVMVYLFGTVSNTVTLYVIGGLAGMLVIGAQIGIQVISAESYPTQIRTTGAGYALTMGRFGAIVAGVLGGLLLELGFTFRQFFAFYSLPCLILAGLAFLYRINKADALEKISAKLLQEKEGALKTKVSF
ncbi:MAG: 4-hydroxybenzoate transporter PcaK [Syntrophorhabdus sp. PtaU1.Bin058]|nr:MAG: 4-hydroxybenzoate transporter PcaK [Syntrophorhabdus sp. PtaU1.Bin058]